MSANVYIHLYVYIYIYLWCRSRGQRFSLFYGGMEGKALWENTNGRLGWNNFELLEGWAGTALGNLKVGWEQPWEIGR